MVRQRGIINYLKMYKISDELINFTEKTMNTWKVEWIAGGKDSTQTKKYIPWGCTITICNCDDITQPHTKRMYRWI